MRSMDIRHFDPHAIAPNTKEAIYLEITGTPGGIPIRQTLLTIRGSEPGPLLLLSGGVHGDEWEGPLTIMRLYKELQPQDIKGTFLGLVVANVPAFDAAAHVSPIDGLSMGSVFPGDPNGSVTRQLAYWMGQRLIKPASFFVDFHSSSGDIDMPTLCLYETGTDAAAEMSRRAAEAFRSPVTWAFPNYGPRRAISFAHENGIPTISTECPGSRCVVLDDVRVFQRGVRNVMRILGMLAGDLEGEESAYYLYGNPESSMITAKTSGYMVLERQLLDWVQPGELLGTIYDLRGDVLEEVRAKEAGYVTLRRLVPTVCAGDLLFYLTQKYPPPA